MAVHRTPVLIVYNCRFIILGCYIHYLNCFTKTTTTNHQLNNSQCGIKVLSLKSFWQNWYNSKTMSFSRITRHPAYPHTVQLHTSCLQAITVEPQFSNFICSRRLFEKQFVWKPNYRWLIIQVSSWKGDGQDPKFCPETETFFFFCEQLGPELNCLRWETFENWGLTVTDNPCFSRFSPYLDTCITHHWQGNQILFGSKFGAKSTRLRKSVVGKLWMWNSCFFPRDQSFTWVSMKSV